MEENGSVQFSGNLDPRAQEFRPRRDNHHSFSPEFLPFRPPPPPPPQLPHQVYYPYPPQALPFSDFVGFVQYDHHIPSAYANVEPPPPLPPAVAPTRTLALSSVPSEVSESLIRRELEVFGEVRGIQMERVGYGTVTVHFYDLRHAERALREIREQHMLHQARLRNLFIQNSESFSFNIAPTPPPARGVIAGCVVWARFIVPSCNEVPDGQNQGTLVVFNLDPNVSTRCLKEIFQAFGAVKEVRETPLKRHQRFIEFYDVRDAAMALGEMNGKEIYGKQVDIEFSRPGGYGKKFFNGRPSATSKNPSTTPVFDSTTNVHYSKVATFVSPQPPPLLRRFSSGCSPSNVSPRSFLTETQSSAGKKSSGDPSEGNPNETSIEASLGCLSLGGDVIVGKVADRGPPKRCSKKSQNNQSFTSIKQQQKSAKSWKGSRQAKKLDGRFLISDDSMVETSGSESRTTVMIKNIPNKYSQKLLLNMLDNHCIHCNEQIANGDDQPLSSYDFLYLPIDFNNKCNVGYGFVNMTSPQAAWRLYKAFHNQHWEVFNSRKICAVTYARIQVFPILFQNLWRCIDCFVLIISITVSKNKQKTRTNDEGIRSVEGALQELKVSMRDGPPPASCFLSSSRREATDGASLHCWPQATSAAAHRCYSWPLHHVHPP
ncbi:RNA BINDING PROTEIN [Salix koriyanagi]|uniref:RNA BINDING PROTEIN n=1 Tax=Salix koriyanagi TaxID=2511006 RepID=A0A9Q0WMR8_9ROSI|nr:RNA BINDING PROTEIN [Salix koriyanagi]